jgi:hypothetical protein
MQKFFVKVTKTKLNFFVYLYLSRNAGKTEDFVGQFEKRAPVQASTITVHEYCGKILWILVNFYKKWVGQRGSQKVHSVEKLGSCLLYLIYFHMT